MLEKPTTMKDWAAVDSTVAATEDYALTTNAEADLTHTKKNYGGSGWEVEGVYSVADGTGVKQVSKMTDPLMDKDLAISLKPTDDFLGLMKRTRQAAYARMFFIAATLLFWAALIAYVYFWDVFGLGGWMPHPMNYGRSDGVLTVLFGVVSFFVFSTIPFLMEWRVIDLLNNAKNGGRAEKLMAVANDNSEFLEDFLNQFLNIRQVSNGLGLAKNAPKKVTKFWMAYTRANTNVWKEISTESNGDGYSDRILLYGLVSDGTKDAKLSITLEFSDKYRKLKVKSYKLEAMND